MQTAWDFEGQVRFLSPEEGGRRTPARMGYFPELAYPEFDDKGHWIARPVAGFRADGMAYEDGEELENEVTFRFWFLHRTFAEQIHRPRLQPGRRFDLMEAMRIVANGVVVTTNFD